MGGPVPRGRVEAPNEALRWLFALAMLCCVALRWMNWPPERESAFDMKAHMMTENDSLCVTVHYTTECDTLYLESVTVDTIKHHSPPRKKGRVVFDR